MLADTRSNELLRKFSGQWLYLWNLLHDPPDPGDFPLFNDALGHASLSETELFFELILRENRGVTDLLGAADFDFADEMFFLLRTDPGMHVLATTTDPTGKVVPQLWTYEKTIPGGKPYRAFVTLQGHKITNFDNPVYQGLLLRGIAWAGKRPVDSLLKTNTH
jgi:Protein of unknown function (DUF1592)/Trehalose utilisation